MNNRQIYLKIDRKRIKGTINGHDIHEGSIQNIRMMNLQIQMSRQMDGQIYGQVDGQINGLIDGYIDGQIDGPIIGYIDGQIDGYMNGRLERKVDGQIDDQVNGQIIIYKYILINNYLIVYLLGPINCIMEEPRKGQMPAI